MIPRPPRLTRTTHSFPTRRSSDLRSTWSVCPLLIGVDCECRGGRRRASDALDDDGGGHAAAGAHRDEAALEVAALELVEHGADERSEEHTSELQSLMRISYAVFCLKKKKT